jgi:hypothetical protein
MAIAILVVNVALYLIVAARGRFPFDALGGAILPDFMAHFTGGKLVLAGRTADLYDVRAQHAVQVAVTGDPSFLDLFLSPPLAAYLYAPFALLPYGAACAAWTTTSLALLGLSAAGLRRLAPSLPGERFALTLLVVASSQPMIQLLGSGQDTPLSLALWVTGVGFALGSGAMEETIAGAVFSLGLFKPQLFVLPPLVLATLGRRRAVGAWLAGALAQAALTLQLFGPSAFRGWWAVLRSPEYVEFLSTVRASRMTSVLPFVRSVLPPGSGTAATVLGGAVSAAVVVATLARLAPRPSGSIDPRGAWALACLATLIASPHLFGYDLVLLVVPVALWLELQPTLPAGTRHALVAIFLLTWTAAPRAWLEHAPWPLSVLGGTWVVPPLVLVWSRPPGRGAVTG